MARQRSQPARLCAPPAAVGGGAMGLGVAAHAQRVDGRVSSEKLRNRREQSAGSINEAI